MRYKKLDGVLTAIWLLRRSGAGRDGPADGRMREKAEAVCGCAKGTSNKKWYGDYHCSPLHGDRLVAASLLLALYPHQG